MAFTVEDGTGVTAANSYVSIAYADTYFTEHLYYSEAWDDYTLAQKQNALMAASAFLDATYDWLGSKTVDASGLRWPRSGVLDLDNLEIDEDTIPAGLKKATAELAAELLVEDRLAAPDSTGISELKVDVIELKFTEGAGGTSKPVLTGRVQAFLRGLGTTVLGGRSVKLFRS